MNRISLVLVAALVAAWPARADDEQKAQKLYAEGESDYKAGKYDDALAAFMAAYDTVPVAALLLNMGQCERQLKHHDRAVDYYQRYLKQADDVPNRKDVEDLIASEKALAAKDHPATTTKPAATAPTLGTTPATASPLASTVSKDAHPGDPAIWQQPVFWGVAGGAALAVLVGGTVAVVVATQPPPAKPTGSLGTFDLRSP
jgi:hypothetical protein